jgi:hypothetical protein
VKVQLHVLLTLALNRREWSASCHAALAPGGKGLKILLDRRLDALQSWMGSSEEEKNMLPLSGTENLILDSK